MTEMQNVLIKMKKKLDNFDHSETNVELNIIYLYRY